MDRLFKRILQGVSRRESSEVREHNVFQSHALKNGAEYHRALFHLRSQKQKEPDQRQPVIGEENSTEDKNRGECLPNRYRASRGMNGVHAAAEEGAQHASA